jgi:hypothetical protein
MKMNERSVNISKSDASSLSTGELVMISIDGQFISSFPFKISGVTIKKGKISKFTLQDTSCKKIINLFVNKSADSEDVKFEKPTPLCSKCGAHIEKAEWKKCKSCGTKFAE